MLNQLDTQLVLKAATLRNRPNSQISKIIFSSTIVLIKKKKTRQI